MRTLSLVLLAAVIVRPLQSAVVISRSDEAMLRAAPAIVTGTVVEVYPRHDDRGDIETVTRILVDETIKGTVAAGEILDLVQFGGALDGRVQAQSGAPRYETGVRYLVVLDRNGRGLWTTFDLALGQFRFVLRDGKQSLVRDTSEIAGWLESGEPFRDHERSARQFLELARSIARTQTLQSRVVAAPLALLDFDLKSVAQTAVGKWTGGAAAMNDTVSATPAGGDTKLLADCESRIIADDPHGDVAGSCCPGVIASAFFGCGSPCGTCPSSVKNGETYMALEAMDIVVNDGASSANIPAESFLSAIVHELGHTWGFRHSNQNNTLTGPCALPLPCDAHAIMNSMLLQGVNGALQSWDRDAANEVYGDGSRQASFTGTQYVVALNNQPVRRPTATSWRISQGVAACAPPSIATQPAGGSIGAGQQLTLSVAAGGSGPLTYQWYIGAPPNTATPAGVGASIIVSPAATTSYWVRVTGQCAPPADSNAAVVQVTTAGCTPPSIVNEPADQQIGAGMTATLFVGYSGSAGSVTWYRGAAPDVSDPAGSGQSFVTGPLAVTTRYWARVANSCGQKNSRTVTISVPGACNAPAITAISDDTTVISNTAVTLTVTATGDPALHYQWFRGDAGNPVGSDSASFVTPPLFADAKFWVTVSNACASAQSRSVSITVVPAKPRAARH